MVTSMLEKAIEIEGLLRIIRDGNPLPETYILLNIKAAELAEQAASLEEKTSAPEQEKTAADFVMAPAAAPAAAAPEVVFSIQQPVQKQEATARIIIEEVSDLGEDDSNMATEDLALIEEDDILLSFEDTAEFQLPTPADAAATPGSEENTEDSDSDPGNFTVEEPKPHAAKPDAHSETRPAEPTKARQPERQETKPEAPASSAPKRAAKLKASFSLNDRFLYSRELFNGNMKMFDSTLDFLEGVDDYSIIEDYFYSELEWNPENRFVANFMEILRPNFKE